MLYLASKSPRRRELLQQIGLEFSVLSPTVNETEITAKYLSTAPAETASALTLAEPENAEALVLNLAKAKALSCSSQLELREGDLILASDTIVVLGDQLYGKPGDAAMAQAYLYSLLGHSHRVITACAILDAHGEIRAHFAETCEVRFIPRSKQAERLIETYIASGSPLDKAGAYGIQDFGGLLIESIRGDYYTVVGLPLSRTWRELDRLLNRES